MRKILLLVILVGLLAAVDVGAKVWAEGQIESRARAELPDRVGVSANIEGFPFLLPLGIRGKVDASVHLENVDARTIVFAEVDIALRDAVLDRGELVRERRVELVDVDQAIVAVEVTASELSRVLKVPLQISGGEVKVRAAGALTVAPARAERGSLVLDVAGVEQAVPIPRNPFVPCSVSDLAVLAGRVRLSCTVDFVPRGLFREYERRRR